MRGWERTLQNLLHMDGEVTHMCDVLGEAVIWKDDFDCVEGLWVAVIAHPYVKGRYEITIEQDGIKWHAGFYETDPDTVEYRAFEAAYFFRNPRELFSLNLEH